MFTQLENSLKSEASAYRMIKEFKQSILYMQARHKDTVNARQLEGKDKATQMVMSGEGKRRMDAVRDISHKLGLLEQQKLAALELHQSRVMAYTNYALILLTLIDLILVSAAFIFLLKSLKTSKAIQAHLNDLHVESLKNSALLTHKNQVQSLQARFNEALQSVLTLDEAYSVISNYCLHLFPQHSGALYIKSNSKDYFERKLQWGEIPQIEGFEPGECWAARSNIIYRYDFISKNLPCQHYTSDEHSHIAMCLPLSSSEEMLGVMTLIDPAKHIGPDETFGEDLEVALREVISFIGQAITNLKLTENLKTSAIVDVLTGLFNRRYLSETLTREIARSQRINHSLSILMLDVDHFKMFNDQYGHQAGDLVLKKVGSLLKRHCRTSDIACRFGGEEFILVLPETDVHLATKRAEEIRSAINAISLTYGGTILPAITISVGISVCPSDASEAESLLKAADEALYQAKRYGRDQVQVYLKP